METWKNIVEELRDISLAVANIGNSNVFTVPEEYFNTLAGNILSHVYISALPKNVPYTLPSKEYFEDLSAQVLEKIKSPAKDDAIEKINASFADLGNLNHQPVFSMPSGYFEALPDSILNKIKTQNFKQDNDVYQELEQIAPLLNTVSKANIYTVPQGYFESIKIEIAATAKNNQPGKVIPLQSRLRRTIMYAVAACIATVMLFTGYQFYNNGSNSKNALTANTEYYKSLTNVDIQKELAALSDDEINKFLNLQDYNLIESDTYLDTEVLDVQNFLQNASDEEILMYLKENTQPGEKKYNF